MLMYNSKKKVIAYKYFRRLSFCLILIFPLELDSFRSETLKVGI